jgi:hypothetical protein
MRSSGVALLKAARVSVVRSTNHHTTWGIRAGETGGGPPILKRPSPFPKSCSGYLVPIARKMILRPVSIQLLVKCKLRGRHRYLNRKLYLINEFTLNAKKPAASSLAFSLVYLR